MVASCIRAFEQEFRNHLGSRCPRPRDLQVPLITGYDEKAGRFLYEQQYGRQQPDWTYASTRMA